MKFATNIPDEPGGRQRMGDAARDLQPCLCKLAALDCLDCPAPMCVHDLERGRMGRATLMESINAFVMCAHRRAVGQGQDAVAMSRKAVLDWFKARQEIPSIMRARQILDAIPDRPTGTGVRYTGPLCAGAEAVPTW